jgi:uncharacterized protein YqgV (UPF0045/DUF77 family)
MPSRSRVERSRARRQAPSRLSAQVSLYPLRQTSIGPPIRHAVRCLREHGVSVRVGEMSTLVWGEEEVLFSALREAFHQAAKQGDAVMSTSVSNACPEPGLALLFHRRT